MKTRFLLPRVAHEALQVRAAERGQTVSQYLRDLVGRDEAGGVVELGDGSELDLAEAGKLAYQAVVRRLKDDASKPVGDTALTKFAQWHMDLVEQERREAEARRPDPEADVAQADDFLMGLRQVERERRLPRARVREILERYVALCDAHVEQARVFGREISA